MVRFIRHDNFISLILHHFSCFLYSLLGLSDSVLDRISNSFLHGFYSIQVVYVKVIAQTQGLYNDRVLNNNIIYERGGCVANFGQSQGEPSLRTITTYPFLALILFSSSCSSM